MPMGLRLGLGLGNINGRPGWLSAIGVPTTATLAWDFQNARSWPTPWPDSYTYTRTGTGTFRTAAGVVTSFSANVLRRTDLGTVIEPSVENLCTYSAAIGGTNWTELNSPTLTLNAALAPDGSMTATSFVCGANPSGGAYQDITVSGAEAATSVFLKNVDSAKTAIIQFDQTNGTQRVTSVVTWSGADISDVTNGTSVALTNGWHRVLLTPTTHVGTTCRFIVRHTTGTENDTFYAWGGQVVDDDTQYEYVPTPTVAATKGADALTLVKPGNHDIPFVFDDDSTQTISSQNGNYAVSTSLNRPIIKYGYAVPLA